MIKMDGLSLRRALRVGALSTLGLAFAPAVCQAGSEKRPAQAAKAGADAASVPADFRSDLQAMMDSAVNNPAVKITVASLKADQWIVLLSGAVAPQQAITDALAAAKKAIDGAELGNVKLIDAMSSAQKEDRYQWVWHNGYLLNDKTFDGSLVLADLAVGINAMFKKMPGDPDIVTQKNDDFWICGADKQVKAVRALLATIDAPAPLVKMEMWAIQYAGSQRDVSARMQRLNDDIANTQTLVEEAKASLTDAVHQFSGSVAGDAHYIQLKNAGFDVDTQGSLSLAESLVCIGAVDNRAALLDRARLTFRDILDRSVPSGPRHGRDLQARFPNLVQGGGTAGSPYQIDSDKLFMNLYALLIHPKTGPVDAWLASDQKSLDAFSQAIANYAVFVDSLEMNGPRQPETTEGAYKTLPNAPENLAKQKRHHESAAGASRQCGEPGLAGDAFHSPAAAGAGGLRH